MTTKRILPILLAVLALLSTPVAAREPAARDTATTSTEWLSVLLEGRKVGHARIERSEDAERVRTEQFMEFELGRDGVQIVMSTQEIHEEAPDGTALAFTSISTISGLEMRVEGRRRDDGRFAVRSGAAGSLRESELDWPEGAVLAHGSELHLRAAGIDPGSQVEIPVFQPLLQEAVILRHEVLGPSQVDLPGTGPTELIEARQTLAFPGGDMVSRVWMDRELNLQRMTMAILGQTLELLACDRDCALAANQPAEILTSSLVAMPRRLERSELAHPLRVRLRSEVALADWPGIDGQRLHPLGEDRYEFDSWSDQPDPVTAPQARDLIATDWLDYEAEPVQALLVGVDAEGSASDRMRRLETLVRDHIRSKNLNIGYASASDSARLREGDCTEHAVLLAALGRAIGIPTRVVNGLAYTEDFGGSPSLVPHAWVAAWSGEQWLAYDAALPGRQLRIAMHADDGDPWRFYSNLDAFNGMRVESISIIDSDSDGSD